MFVRRCACPSTYGRVTLAGRMSVELYQAVWIAEGGKNIARKCRNFNVIRTLPVLFRLVSGDVRNELLELVLSRHHILCINWLLQIDNMVMVVVRICKDKCSKFDVTNLIFTKIN
jgi:hypothetical protein